MSGEIRQIQPQDSEIQEEWILEGDLIGFIAVNACRWDKIGGWQVFVGAMEFVNEDPLESELRLHILTALSNVLGVTSADEQDRETFFVTGTPAGRALIEATVHALDDFDERIGPYLA
jgi:hypothetical protein